MKKVSKLSQIYYSIASIIALALIWSGVYAFQNFTQLKSSASQINSSIDQGATLSLTSKDNFVIGSEATINLDINIVIDPILSSNIYLIYDPAYIEPESMDSSGILGSPIKSNINSSTGTINLLYAPLSGVTQSGTVASLKVMPKQKGSTTITYSPTAPTTVSTLNSADITPSLDLINLIID